MQFVRRVCSRALTAPLLTMAMAWIVAGCGEPEAREAVPASEYRGEDAGEAWIAPLGESTFEVVELELGKRVGRNMRIADATQVFDAGDPVYLVVITEGGDSGGRLVVRWKDAHGSLLHREVEFVPPGRSYVEHRAFLPGAWSPGSYTVEVEVNGEPAGRVHFEVRAPKGEKGRDGAV